jgi:hypothetical protein
MRHEVIFPVLVVELELRAFLLQERAFSGVEFAEGL